MMTGLQVTVIDSLDQLRASGGCWDDLWWRSPVTIPTARAELVAQWVERFAPQAPFRAVLVQQRGRLVGALPLIGVRLQGWLEAAGLPSNEWSSAGQLLIDGQADAAAVADALVAALDQLPWPLLWLDGVLGQSPSWSALRAAVDRCGLPALYKPQYQVGRIELDSPWRVYQQSWSKNHRRKMSKLVRRLQSDGRWQLRLEGPTDAEQAAGLLMQGLQVEDRSWKGRQGTSVLRTPGMPEYFLSQARQLARWGQFELALLEHCGRPVAFEYAWNAKGVYHSFKVGYDEADAAFSPGQLLMYFLLERFHGQPERRAVDCLGRLDQAISRWRPAPYGVGRLAIASQMLGRLWLASYKHLWPPLSRWPGCALPLDGLCPTVIDSRPVT